MILDEVGEGEMVENKLVIPDEMMQYLNQVIMLIYFLNYLDLYFSYANFF